MNKTVELNISRDQAAQFIDWLANDGYWGHTLTDFDIKHGEEKIDFIINGHKLSNYSNQKDHVIIDDGYELASVNYGLIQDETGSYIPLEYCLKKLGF